MSDDLESFFGRVLTVINKTSLNAHSRDSSRNQTDNGRLVVKDRLYLSKKIIAVLIITSHHGFSLNSMKIIMEDQSTFYSL